VPNESLKRAASNRYGILEFTAAEAA
jgi:hypothetical protein